MKRKVIDIGKPLPNPPDFNKENFIDGNRKDFERALKEIFGEDNIRNIEHKGEFSTVKWVTDNKDEAYFTPNLEDLYVGYECEALDSEIQWKPVKLNSPNGWQVGIDDFKYKRCKLRTKFLTADQIEKEGWEFENGEYYKNKHHFQLWNYKKSKWIYIKNDENLNLFIECKSINEFRKLVKWLQI